MFNESFENISTEIIPTLHKILEISTEINFDSQDFDNVTTYFGPKRDPLYIVIPITIIYMLIFITGIIGNISTCIVISKNKSMHTATNYYLFSLAISDFLLLLSGVPQEIYSIWSRYPYVFGEAFCILRGLMAETSANATVLTITAFTVERYVAICHPFLSHTLSKLSRAVRLIILVWIISISAAIPQALQFGVVNSHGIDQCHVKHIILQHSFELSTFVFFFAPMTLITVLYILIGLKLRSSSIIKRENGGSLQRRTCINSCRQPGYNQGTRRVLKMLVAVVVAFFICWAPFHAQRLYAIYGTNPDKPNDFILKIYAVMTYISGVLYYISTCINPLLYNIMSNKFREAFKATLVKCCHLSRRGYDKKRAYRVLSRTKRGCSGRQESAECSGSSFRDESLHSTSTQKQSIDSYSLMQKPLYSKKIYGQHKNQHEMFNVTECCTYSGILHHQENTNKHEEKIILYPLQTTTTTTTSSFSDNHRNLSMKNQQMLLNIYSNQTTDNIDSIHHENCDKKILNVSLNSQLPSSSNLKVLYNKYGELEISVTNNHKTFKNNNKHKYRFLNLFKSSSSGSSSHHHHHNNFRKQKNITFVSPTFDDRKKFSSSMANESVLAIGPTISISSDDGIVSNSSLKDFDNQTELTDELNSYMEEIKMREKR